MKVSRIKNPDGTSCVILNEVSNDDLKQLYVRVSLINDHIVTAMGEGFRGKKLPEQSFGCEFSHIFGGVWDAR